MSTSLQLPGQMPPTRRRPNRWWVVAAAAVLVTTGGGVVVGLVSGGPARSAGMTVGTALPAAGTGAPAVPAAGTGAPAAGTGAPAAPAAVPAAGPGATRAPAPATVAAAQWLWPFSGRSDVAAWQRAHRAGGTQLWHLDAGLTALGFADQLGYQDIDRVLRSDVDGAEAYLAIGFRLPDGSPHTAADVHLVKVGTGADAPWEVVGTRDTTLTLDRPAYGSVVASPMTVGGRFTGADERVVVTLHAPAGDLHATPAAVEAGGQRAPWSVRVSFTGTPGTVITVAAATGGHVAAVERFAVTGVRTGAAAPPPVADDIDGDGLRDTVGVPAPGVLQVHYGSGRTETVTVPAEPGDGRVQGLVDADGDGRDEVFVHVGTGASTDQTAVLRYVSGRLQLVTSGAHPLTLVAGASITHADTWACGRPAAPIVWWSGTSTDGLTYRGTVVSYGFSGATAVPVSTRPLTVGGSTEPPTGCGTIPTG